MISRHSSLLLLLLLCNRVSLLSHHTDATSVANVHALAAQLFTAVVFAELGEPHMHVLQQSAPRIGLCTATSFVWHGVA